MSDASPTTDILMRLQCTTRPDHALVHEAADEIERLRAALRRLGSMETMTVPFFIPRGAIAKELKARITFARKAIGDE